MPKIGGLLCPIGVIIVANIVIFTMVVIRLGRTIRTTSPKRESIIMRVKEGRQRLQKAICIFLLLGLTWSSGYLLLIGTDFNQIFQIIFIALNSFQGFFIFVIYCLRQRVVRAELSRMCGCGESKKRRSISLSSASQREETVKTRHTEMQSTTVGPSYQGIELEISDAEDAVSQPNGGTSREAGDCTELEPGRPDRERGTRKSSAHPVRQRKSWLSYAEIRQHLEVVLSRHARGRRSRKRKEDLSSECWAAGKQDKNMSLESRE
ncbi:adhesion G-protein coupled receptor G7-like [Lytechinus pictus]|uniref:adhesion G-protein coupled receptor G7-like n=1 Tax=Lytechinus pictus TaxID=7653 RepID=UPI0030B9D6B6